MFLLEIEWRSKREFFVTEKWAEKIDQVYYTYPWVNHNHYSPDYN